jgi:hypothetical protein
MVLQATYLFMEDLLIRPVQLWYLGFGSLPLMKSFNYTASSNRVLWRDVVFAGRGLPR